MLRLLHLSTELCHALLRGSILLFVLDPDFDVRCAVPYF